MADFNTLYEQLKASAQSAAKSANTLVTMMTADENTDVGIDGFGLKPSFSKQLKTWTQPLIDQMSAFLDQSVATFDQSVAKFDQSVAKFDQLLVTSVATFDKLLVTSDARVTQFLQNSGYQVIGDYTDGPYTIGNYNSVVKYDGSLYKLKSDTDVPFTTTGTTASSWVNDSSHFYAIGGDMLSQQLASDLPGNGSSLIGDEVDGTVKDALVRSRLNTREIWRRSLAGAGLSLVNGSFEEGATANNKTDAIWYIAGGQCYTWDGALPKTIPASSSPADTGGVADGAWRPLGLKQGVLNIVAFGAVGDGVTDNSAVFSSVLSAAKSSGKTIYIPSGVFKTGTSLEGDFLNIRGEHPIYSIILKDGSSPAVRVGGISTVSNLTIKFTSADTATEGTHVGVYCGTSQPLCKGSKLSTLRFDNVGTAIYDAPHPTFSVSFSDIDIRNYFFAGLLFTSDARTDNYFNNIYLGGSSTANDGRVTPTYGIAFKGFNDTGSVMTSINIESIKSDNAFFIEDVSYLNVSHLHMEDVCVSSAGASCVTISRSSVNFGVIDFWYSTIKTDSAILRIKDTIRYISTMISQGEVRNLTVGRLDLLGMYADEARTQSDTSSVSGFMIIDRPSSSDTGVFRVSVAAFAGHTFAGVDASNYNLENKVTTNALIERLGSFQMQNKPRLAVVGSGTTTAITRGTGMVVVNISGNSTITLPKVDPGYTQQIALLVVNYEGPVLTISPASGNMVTTPTISTPGYWDLVSDGYSRWFVIRTSNY